MAAGNAPCPYSPPPPPLLQVRPEYIVPLVEELHGKKWPKFNSEKICHIAYGRIQVRSVCRGAGLAVLGARCVRAVRTFSRTH